MVADQQSEGRWPVNVHITRIPKIFGFNLFDLVALGMAFLFGLLVGYLVTTIIPIATTVYWIVYGIVIVALTVIFRRAAATGHPSYITSWIAFHLLQPKQVDVVYARLRKRKK